jgi:pyrophosphatase PpaX
MPSIPRPPAAILFDVDGTLLDTRAYILGAYRVTCDTHKVAYPGDEFIENNVGRKLEDVYLEFAPANLLPILIATHRAFQRGNVDLVRPFAGVRDVLERLRVERIGLGAITSRSKLTSGPTLQVNGLLQYFNILVSAEDVPKLKPDPEPLRFALEALTAVRPWANETAVMVGDSVFDVQAAKAFGIPAVAVTYGIPGLRVLDSGPDAAVASFTELLDLFGFTV